MKIKEEKRSVLSIKVDRAHHFLGEQDLPEFYRTVKGPWEIPLSEIDWLYERYDVMLTTTRDGERVLRLDVRGGGFRSR